MSKATGDYEEYIWDHRNRLVAVEFHSSTGTLTRVIEYRYDAFDRLIGRLHDTDGVAGFEEEEYYVHDSAPGKGGLDDIVLAYDENGNVTHRYLHGPGVDQIWADESAVDNLLWALDDRQGTVKDWADYDPATDATSVYNHVEYDSFGNVLTRSNSTHEITVGYTGRYVDPVTGLQWNRGRWYDPATGRWLSEDPIGFAGGDVNLSRYVGNSPTNGVDPTGLMDYNVITWHHLYPQGEYFRNFLKNKGIDPSFLHSPANGWYLLGEDHTQLQENCPRGNTPNTNWNTDWKRWILTQKGDKTRLKDVLEQMDEMKRIYGLTDGDGNALKGSSVSDVDGMPYNTWKRGDNARSSFRTRTNTSGWAPSEAELNRNKANAIANGRLKVAPHTPGVKPGLLGRVGRVGRLGARCIAPFNFAYEGFKEWWTEDYKKDKLPTVGLGIYWPAYEHPMPPDPL